MYAILDIETTGGKYNEEGVTEIAIYKFDGEQIIDQFITLVNPEREIQPFVSHLTGIHEGMLKNAPKFHEIAKRIIEITQNCTIVAHNSSFDYRILKTEYDRLGYNFERDTICTVELSRKLIPDQDSYSLGKLCKALGIPLSDRHRANGDALATIQLFKLLLAKDTNKIIVEQATKFFDYKKTSEKLIKMLGSIPTTGGIYYLHREDGKIIFMGKGKNIKKELTKIFLKTSKRAKKIQEYTANISYEITGNDLFTELKYYIELENNHPKFNYRIRKKIVYESFSNQNMILIEKGREVEENAIILIENNEVQGYGYTNLSFQIQQLDILKTLITPIENKILAKTIIKNYLKNNTVKKIVRY